MRYGRKQFINQLGINENLQLIQTVKAYFTVYHWMQDFREILSITEKDLRRLKTELTRPFFIALKLQR